MTAWDLANLSGSAIAQIAQATNDWHAANAAGNRAGMDAAHAAANAARSSGLSSGQYVSDEGYVRNSGGSVVSGGSSSGNNGGGAPAAPPPQLAPFTGNTLVGIATAAALFTVSAVSAVIGTKSASDIGGASELRFINLVGGAGGSKPAIMQLSGGRLKAAYNEYKAFNQPLLASLRAYSLSLTADAYAKQYAKENNLYMMDDDGNPTKALNTAHNEADAGRHMVWNVLMTLLMSREQAAIFGNNHEIMELQNLGWITEIDGNIIKSQLNQATLQDMWNNEVGRLVASDHEIGEDIAIKLFEYALENNMLITDANTAFEQLGIQGYADEAYNRIAVEWDTKNHTITVIKEGLNDKVITLGQMK